MARRSTRDEHHPEMTITNEDLRVRCPDCARILAPSHFAHRQRSGFLGRDRCNGCRVRADRAYRDHLDIEARKAEQV